MKDKVIVWFSCGAASACAAKLASVLYGDELNVVYCDTMSSEHPDNQRFFNDVQRWIGRDITVIKSTRFDSVDEVFEKRKYLAGRLGAPCTVEMKKRPRFEFQGANDVHIFGMTADEAKRAKRFTENNPELRLRWILEESGLTKEDCLEMLKDAGIELPAMYKLGYKNNNCIGCVKATSPAYWNKVRADFPEVFEKRCQQSRLYGARLVRVNNVRLFLDELKPENVEVVEEDLSCGPQCTGVPEGYESLDEPLIEPIIEPTELLGYAALRRQRQLNESTQRTCAAPNCGKSLPVNSHHRRLYCSGQCRLNAQPTNRTRNASGKKRTDYHREYQERRRRLIAQGRWNPKKGQGVNQ